MIRILFTTAPASETAGREELSATIPGLNGLRSLSPGVVMGDAPVAWREITAVLGAAPPVWVRHLHPVTQTAPLSGDARDLAVLESVLPSALMDLDVALSFSVQARLIGEGVRRAYSRYDINERLAAVASSWGAAIDVREPDQVISVACTDESAFLGLSLAAHNLSSWAGGEIRFRKEPEQISRAEFKLLEALEVFGIELPSEGRALDMGAAPGGWSRILAGRGLEVTVVDPAELDPRVLKLPGVRHVRSTVQDARLDGPYDVILNDMRMDARDSARLMSAAAGQLQEGGIALMTLKLPENRQESVAEAAFKILRKAFEITGARQLFHNRSEVTAALALAR